MTVKEALDWCEQFVDNLVMANVDTKKRTLGLQAMQTCKSALEKQIAMKPIEDISKDYEGTIIDDVFFCPKCTRTICFGSENNLAENYPYCNCGQALDWSDTNDR